MRKKIIIIIVLLIFAIIVLKFSGKLIIVDKNYERINISFNKDFIKIDGPYIKFITEDSVQVINVNSEKKILKAKKGIDDYFTCKTESGFNFNFNLNNNLINDEKIKLNSNEKVLVLSDIEGNFKVFSDFLINNGVIDNNYDWIFKNNHLVLNGDYFDRGQDVVACLWLIYKLDYQAKNNNGGVHFILGNHEELNLRGYVKYVKPKYLGLANELGIDYKELYSNNTVLGKWLRTQNSAEIINNNLFVHGGVSPRNVKENLTIGRINKITKKYLGVDRRKLEDSSEADLVFDRQGNMWYRGFFMDYKKYYKRLTENEVDDILDFYNVDHIIVGHTIVDKVKTEYNNKVIAIDVMSKDDPRRKDDDAVAEKTEGLLINGNEYFRLLQNGEKFLLFKTNVNRKYD